MTGEPARPRPNLEPVSRIVEAVAPARLGSGFRWLLASATGSEPGWSWHGTRIGAEWTLPDEPSWHWGTAGVLAFLARLDGWPVDSPGMQPALVPLRPVG